MSLLSDFRQVNRWQRPFDWLQITKPGLSEEKIVLLCAVYADGSNALALRVSVSTGTFTVDWGDGSTPTTHTSDTNANAVLSYAGVAGTDCSEGYRQAIVTITPTTAGATIVSATQLSRLPTGYGASSTVMAPILEVYVSMPTSTNAGSLLTTTYTAVRYAWLNIPATTTVSLLFSSQVLLREVEFAQAISTAVPLTWIFSGSSLLTSVVYPGGFQALLGTPSGSFQGMFNGLNSFHIDLVTLDANGVTSASGFANTFANAYGVKSVVVTGTFPAVVNRLDTTFQNCYSLTSVSLPPITSNFTIMTSAFAGCRFLREVVLTGDMSGVTTTTTMFTFGGNLRRCVLPGLRVGFSVAHNTLSAAALDEMFTALGTANGAQTITVTGNPGAATCNTSIATAKGWTVTV